MQVCLADVQTTKGEATAAEFQRTFGKDRAMFVRCDVKSVEDMRSINALCLNAILLLWGVGRGGIFK